MDENAQLAALKKVYPLKDAEVSPRRFDSGLIRWARWDRVRAARVAVKPRKQRSSKDAMEMRRVSCGVLRVCTLGAMETIVTILSGILLAACLLVIGILMFGGPDNNRPR